MSDDALIRLENLKRLNLTPAQLSETVGNRYTYWRDLLAGKKSFGEKIARKIEEKLNLPRGSLDGSDSRPDAEWPYTLFTRADYMLVSPEYRTRVENELAGEIQRAKGAPPARSATDIRKLLLDKERRSTIDRRNLKRH